MAGDPEYLLFHVDGNSQLYEGGSRLDRFFKIIVDMTNFRFMNPPISKHDLKSIGDDGNGSLSSLWAEFKRESGDLGAWIELSNDDELKVMLGIEASSNPWIYLAFNNSYISNPVQESRIHVNSIVELSEAIYLALHPAYGFGLVTPSNYSFSELDKRQPVLTAVHDFNLLGPSLVQQIGPERILSIPTWKTHRFDDGGIFLIMSPSPIAEWEDYSANYEEAARILNVDDIYQGG